MAFQTKSSVLSVKKETTEAELIYEASGADFTVLREGFDFTSAVETVEADELTNDIGKAKAFLSKEAPTFSLPKYFKHSGVEGQEPDYGVLIEAGFGARVVNATEYDTIAGSTAGTAAVAGTVVVDAGEGVNFAQGQALLIKDGANGYSVRNITGISTDTLTLAYNLSAAPALGVDLGKAIHYQVQASGHPSVSLHRYQAGTSSAVHEAISGARVTSMSIEGAANSLYEINFEGEGVKSFRNPIEITAANLDVDFTDDGGTKAAVLEIKSYKTPVDLCREIATKMSAASVNVISCSFDDATGKYTLSSDGTTFELLWSTGAGTATSVGTTIGFLVAADDTGATSYEADNALSYDPPFTPAFDDNDPLVVRGAELLLGEFSKSICRDASSFSVSISTPKQDVDNFCAESGVSESIVAEREVTASGTLILKKHEISDFDLFVNNTTTQAAFTVGQKTGGNWVAGTVCNVFLEAATITSDVIADEDDVQIRTVELSGLVTSTKKDVHINFL